MKSDSQWMERALRWRRITPVFTALSWLQEAPSRSFQWAPLQQRNFLAKDYDSSSWNSVGDWRWPNVISFFFLRHLQFYFISNRLSHSKEKEIQFGQSMDLFGGEGKLPDVNSFEVILCPVWLLPSRLNRLTPRNECCPTPWRENAYFSWTAF